MKSNSIERAVLISETARGKENYEDYVAAALLHDVVEDSDYTIQDLADEGFSTSVLEALELLTHKDGKDMKSMLEH